MNKVSLVRWLLTLLVIALACVFVAVRYNAYFRNPWTRDALVQAEVVKVAARVSAPVQAVHVRNNQFVRKGEPLFDLEDKTFRVALEQAEAELRQKEAALLAAQSLAGRDERLETQGPGAISSESVRQAEDRLRSARAAVEVARAGVEGARLMLSFSRVVAPVDGYITNLTLQTGTMAVAYEPLLALISAGTFRIDAFFRETLIARFKPGDAALVTLMSYPDTPLRAVVESIGWGIARHNGSTGEDLLPAVSPTFEWIRLAQRIPVRIRLLDPPPSVELRMGTTASVLVRVRGGASEDPIPLPSFLQ